MSIIIMFFFVLVPLVLGTIVLGATFHHWYKEAKNSQEGTSKIEK